MHRSTRLLTALLLLALLAACGETPAPPDPAANCPLTTPDRLKPPADAAVLSTPDWGYYYVNENLSIWASANWSEAGPDYLKAGERGNKVAWFRPEGALLTISGRRLDGEAEAMQSELPCCYPTRFQASGLYFPTAGCWEVTAAAEGRKLTFVVWVEP